MRRIRKATTPRRAGATVEGLRVFTLPPVAGMRVEAWRLTLASALTLSLFIVLFVFY
jgi:hypothetical protein